MRQVCFLYKGDEAGSATLRDALDASAINLDVRFWSDVHTTDPGFGAQLRDELRQCDAIVQCVGPKGIGFYQNINEIDETIDALRARSSRRLAVVLLDGAAMPDGFARFDALPNPRVAVAQTSAALDARAVLLAALPDLVEIPPGPEAARAAEINRRTFSIAKPQCLTIVLGPFAAAEIDQTTSTPDSTMAALLGGYHLPGAVPWLDVLGSVARATVGADDEAADLIQRAMQPGLGASGQLYRYLRMLAANWVRESPKSRLFLIVCTPDQELDLELEREGAPVPHVRLVHSPHSPKRLVAERIGVENLSRPTTTPIDDPELALPAEDKVVLIKPFGSFRDPANLLLTAEQWRDETAGQQMPLPVGLDTEISRSVILTLGAGAFSPSLHVVFRALMRRALSNVEKHTFRYLAHDPGVEVADRLHKLERAMAAEGGEFSEKYKDYLWEVYGLKLDRLRPLPLLARLDQLVRARV